MKKDAKQRATTEIANSWSGRSTINHVRSQDTSPLVRAAAGVRGNAQESILTVCGTWSRGKKTPLTWNIGIMNTVKRLFIAPMVLAVAVKIRAMEATVRPIR